MPYGTISKPNPEARKQRTEQMRINIMKMHRQGIETDIIAERYGVTRAWVREIIAEEKGKRNG
jgi:uncharacterized protein (DUF433 family)